MTAPRSLSRAAALRGLAALSAAAGAGGIAAAQAPAQVQIATGPVEDAVPVLYAVDAGLFRRAGLDITYTRMANGGAVQSAVLGNALQFGFTSVVNLAEAHEHGVDLPIVALGTLYTSASASGLLFVRSDSPIVNAHDLNGKTVGLSTLKDLNATALYAWMDRNGGDSSSVHGVEIPYPAMLAALEQSRVDATIMLAPFSSQAIASGRVRLLARVYDAISTRFPAAAWFATARYVAANPLTVQRFSQVLHDAAGYVNGHVAQTAPLLAEVTGYDAQTLQSSPRSVLAEHFAPRDIQPLIDAAAKYKILERPFAAQELVAPNILPIWR